MAKILMIVIAVILSACGVRYRDATVLVSDGCLVYVEAATVEQARDITRDWSVSKGCEVRIKTENE